MAINSGGFNRETIIILVMWHKGFILSKEQMKIVDNFFETLEVKLMTEERAKKQDKLKSTTDKLFERLIKDNDKLLLQNIIKKKQKKAFKIGKENK